MKKLDLAGRITLPKEIRERNGYKADDVFEIFERADEIVLKPLKKRYSINENELSVIRDIYNMLKDTDVLEDSKLATLREICRLSEVLCPTCNEPMSLTEDNTYKCMNCEN